MHALFIHDTFYSRNPDSGIYAFGAFPYSLWAERFLPHFDSLTIIGREKTFEPSHRQSAMHSDGLHVDFLLLPNINAPLKRILEAGPIVNKIREQVDRADAIIIRGPSEFGMIAARHAQKVNATKVNAPVAIEMSGCAFDHTWHHSSLTGKFYAPVKYLRARRMVKNADHVIYVTKAFLQSRYPSRAVTENASNVEIESPSPALLPERLSKIKNRQNLVFGMIGNTGNKLKGLDIAITALARIRDQLPPFEFHVLGDHGPAPHSIHDFVKFHSPLTDKNAVLSWLDDIDIYLQPSLHEGLPRALIEAMSRACPCLASDAGGIPELLDSSAIHRRGDVKQLSAHILNALNPSWQTAQASRNFETARNYSRENLLPIREKFWSGFARLARASQLAGQSQHKDILVEI